MIDRALFSKRVFPVLKFLGNFMGGKTFSVRFVHVVLSSLFFMCSCTNHVWHVKSDSAIALSSQVAVSQNFVYPPSPPCVQSACMDWIIES